VEVDDLDAGHRGLGALVTGLDPGARIAGEGVASMSFCARARSPRATAVNAARTLP
jgi:hypothetical protein